jgi:hypothetical protein
MADLGAEVIKIEVPEGGDSSRGSTVMPGFPNTDIAATPGANPAESRRRALTVYSHMIGALLLSRALAHADTALADEILEASRDNLLESEASAMTCRSCSSQIDAPSGMRGR